MPEDNEQTLSRTAHAIAHATDYARVLVAYTEAMVREGVPHEEARAAAYRISHLVVLAPMDPVVLWVNDEGGEPDEDWMPG